MNENVTRLIQLHYVTKGGAHMLKQLPTAELEITLQRLAKRRIEAIAYELIDGVRGEAIGWVEQWDHVRGFVWVFDTNYAE